MAPAAAAAGGNATMAVGTQLMLQSNATGATNCAFTNGGTPGGTVFVPFQAGGCAIPQGVSGIAYVHLTNAQPAGNVLTDNVVVAGVQVIQVS